MKTVHLALGTNLGDRPANLARAIERLSSAEIRVLRASSVWETEPRDLPNQPWFLNQVLEVETSLFPRQLLQRLHRIEREMGRIRATPKGPRLIDIDILFFGRAVVSAPDLEIPHPHMTERRFVLEPLAELVPDLRHPVTRRTVRQMLGDVASQAVRKASSPAAFPPPPSASQ
jgi:2-amino-4-hydroxy-6-hydroxymethyldihydropteridine diphosphokinase